MEDKKLTIRFPEGFVSALNRRHNGMPHTREDIAKAFYIMTKLYERNKNFRKEEDYLLNVEWDKNKIEQHFRSKLWFNAHRRLKRYRKIILETHRAMFNLLVSFDGNPKEEFSEFGCISADEIFEDFKIKYMGEQNVKFN